MGANELALWAHPGDALIPQIGDGQAIVVAEENPYGTPAEVRDETRRLISLGSEGGYILAPAHAVEGDVPLENMLAFIDEALSQPGFTG